MISVVVPAYNAEKTLAACLDGLLAQTTHAEYEIIVVDDGSRDATREIARARGVSLLTQSNRGAAAARNLGAQNARGEIVLFVDADSIPDARWIEALTAPFAHANVAGASGEKKTRQKNLLARFIQVEYDVRYDRIAAHRTIDFVDSSTAAYRRDLFVGSGGFDVTLMEAEDTEFSFRLAERGHTLVLVRDAIVFHTHPTALIEFVRRKYRYAVWRAAVYARYPRKAASDTRTPQTQKVQGALVGLLLVALLAVPVWRESFWAAAAIVVLFLLTTLPFVFRCLSSSWQVALVAPFLLGMSACAGSAGLVLGFLRHRFGRRRGVTESISNGGRGIIR